MKKNYTHSGFIHRIKESIKNQSANAITLKPPRRSKFLLFTVAASMMTLFMATSTIHHSQNICKDAYTTLEVDGVEIGTKIGTELYFSGAEKSQYQSHLIRSPTRMGFSFSDVWDFLASIFAVWFGEEETADEVETQIQAKTLTTNQLLGLMFDCPVGTAPTATVYTLSASCTDGTPNNDAYLQISAASDATHYDFTPSSTYTGNGFVDALPLGTLPFQFGTLSNPSGSQNYTIRIFNSSDACFTDIVVTLNEQDCTIGCNCTDYLYVNDIDRSGVHKFEIDAADGGLTEITSSNGGLWAQNILKPHGAVFDLNGLLYIAQKDGDVNSGLWKLTCEGEVVDTLFYGNFDGSNFNNFVSIDNYLYVNGSDNRDVKVYDLCGETLIGRVDYAPYPGGATENNWELMDGQGGLIYTTDRGLDTFKIYQVPTDVSLYTNPATTTILPYLETNLVIADTEFFGLEQDENGFWYTMIRPDGGSAAIIVMDPMGMVVDTILDPPVGGFDRGSGMEYSEKSDKLYVASRDGDCVAVFDIATRTYIDSLSIPGGGGKDLSLATECCPINNRQVIETIYCGADFSEPVFLNELYNCEGVICESTWEVQSIEPSVDYDPCDQSVMVISNGGCAIFTKSSDGTSGNCGAFEITMNICFITQPIAPEIAVTDNDCDADTPGTFTVTTACGAGSTIEWSTDNGTTWSTTSPTYDNENTQTVITRCVNDADNTCTSAESASVTSMPENCCPDPNCFNITIQQN